MEMMISFYFLFLFVFFPYGFCKNDSCDLRIMVPIRWDSWWTQMSQPLLSHFGRCQIIKKRRGKLILVSTHIPIKHKAEKGGGVDLMIL